MTLFSIGDIALFYRNLGSRDAKQRKKKNPNFSLRKAVFNPDVANAAAVGATLGLGADAVIKNPLGLKTATRKTKVLGIGGTALGAGLAIHNKLKKQRQQ